MASHLIVFTHGDAAPAERYGYVAARLAGAGHRVLMPEAHGHDHSEVTQGHRFTAAVADLDAYISAENEDAELPVVMLGNGAGSSIALGYAVTHQQVLAGLILAAPLAQPAPGPMQRWFRGLGSTLLPDAPAGGDRSHNTADPTVDVDYFADPLTNLGAGSRLSSSAAAARRADKIIDGLDTLTLATLLLWGTREGLTPPGGAEHLLGKLDHAVLTRQTFDALYHELLVGSGRDQVIDAMVAWLDALAT